MTKPVLTFRISFRDGHKIDVRATTADEARKAAAKQHDAFIAKIKIVRGEA